MWRIFLPPHGFIGEPEEVEKTGVGKTNESGRPRVGRSEDWRRRVFNFRRGLEI